MTYFRNTVEADETLAAYVNESTRYKMIGRLTTGSVDGTQTDRPSSFVQAGHKAKAEYPSANDGHDPMKLCGRRPSVPTVKVMNNCRT